MKSLGMIEVSGVTGAIDCLDIMCKSADVEFVTWERKLGGRLVTVVVQGNVSAVTAAVENAVANGIVKPCAYAVIASPHEETWRILQISAARIAQKGR
jgi:microcompartment protein CcmL/EutN